MKYARYDKQGFSVAWCLEGNKVYWHVYHPRYGVRWGYAASEWDAHARVNWAIGDMRQGL